MEDFASAAMLRLIRAGLARQGLAAPEMPATNAAHVPRDGKARALAGIVAAYGARALLAIPEAIDEIDDEPILLALLQAADPADLLQRWARLERFSHASHVIRIVERAVDAVVLEHARRDGGTPPTAEESTLIFALLTKLCEAIGAAGLAAGPADRTEAWRMGGEWRQAALIAKGSRWRIAFAPARAQAPAPPQAAASSSDALADRMRALIAADPARAWTLGRLSRALGLSARSAQRKLAAERTSLTQIVGMARLRYASERLIDGNRPIAEISFAAGFSDQPHFTRSFKARIGCTPAAFRRDFARPPKSGTGS